MSEELNPTGLKEEWSLLLHSFLDENSQQTKLINQMKDVPMTAEQVKVVKKDLSSKRKKLNQSIERIKSKIDQMSTVIENLELVGSDASGLIKEIDFLNNEGAQISSEIHELDKKINKIHEIQEMISA